MLNHVKGKSFLKPLEKNFKLQFFWWHHKPLICLKFLRENLKSIKISNLLKFEIFLKRFKKRFVFTIFTEFFEKCLINLPGCFLCNFSKLNCFHGNMWLDYLFQKSVNTGFPGIILTTRSNFLLVTVTTK